MYFSGFLVDTTTVLVVVETTIRWASTQVSCRLASHLGNLHQRNNRSSLTKRDSLGIFCISFTPSVSKYMSSLEKKFVLKYLSTLTFNVNLYFQNQVSFAYFKFIFPRSTIHHILVSINDLIHLFFSQNPLFLNYVIFW